MSEVELSDYLYDEIEHRDGVAWFEAPKPFRWHRHRWQTRCPHRDGHYVLRCACGATGYTDLGSGWVGERKPRVWP